ncbi:MAG: ABC transporter permease [bacterium]|nr:ABC transporter permease [bacterium]
MQAIQRKLVRNLWNIKGQVIAISLVIAVGVAMFIMYSSTFDSLYRTQQAYYDRHDFADVFARLERAPNRLAARIAAIPGVTRTATRVVAEVTLDVAGMNEPVTGRLISLPEPGDVNGIALQVGRRPDPERPEEVLVSDGFAAAHGMLPGATFDAVINGRLRELRVVGTAMSPEYVYSIRPGALMPDEKRFGVIWVEPRALASAFDMEGAFNDVSLALAPGAQTDEVIAQLDRLLETYGGLGAIPRELQISNWFLASELSQLRGFGTFVPIVFLSVAAFLLNVVLRRMISVQREQIAALKALGYTNREVGWHFAQWSLLISALGGAVGIWLGRWLGRGMINIYNGYFEFPFLAYALTPRVVVGAVLVGLVAAAIGAVGAVRQAVRLPPAEAMRPEPPANYGRTWLERLGVARWLSQPARIVLRNLQRRPLRTASTVLGIAFSGALLIIGLFFNDSIDVLMDVNFHGVQREDVSINLVRPATSRAVHELGRMPGVIEVQPARDLVVRIRAGHRSRRTALTGIAEAARLRRVVSTDFTAETLPGEGLVLSTKLAEILDVGLGSSVTLEVLEGARPVREVVVSGLVEEFMGRRAYVRLDALHRLMRESGVLTGAYMRIDTNQAERLYSELKLMPAVAGVALKAAAIETFQNQMDEMMGVFIFFNIIFAAVITIGVVYNVARIALSERRHELASLRVLGFTRAEISSILLGELAVLTLAGIPLGLWMGYGLAAVMVAAFDTELYRFPLVISVRTYAVSALIVALASAASGLLVRRRLDHLDLVEVLKATE